MTAAEVAQDVRTRVALCFVSDRNGGAEKHVVNLYRSMVDADHIDVVLFGRVGGWQDVDLRAIDVPSGPKWSLRTMPRALFAARRERRAFVAAVTREHSEQPFDFVHMHFKREQILLSGPMSNLATVVWTEHSPLLHGVRGWWIKILYRVASRHVTTVIAVSDATRDNVRRYVAPNVKTVSIDNGVNLSEYRPPSSEQRSEARRKLGITDDTRVVVSLCRLSSSKRVGRSIDAVTACPNVTYLIGGDGPERTELEAYADGRARFLGWVDDATSVLWASDVAIINASPAEGLMLSLLEAAASGCVIVGYHDGPVCTEIEASGGYLLEDGEFLPLDDLVASRRQRGAAAVKWAKGHGQDAWVAAHAAVFSAD